MLRKTSLGALACLWLLSLMVGCSTEPVPSPTSLPTPIPTPTPSPVPTRAGQYGGVLAVALAEEPSLPGLEGELLPSTAAFLAPVYSRLVKADPADMTKIIPDLAESWQVSPDGQVYTFRLRRQVLFHDGLPFTVEDAKFNLERWRAASAQASSSYRGLFSSVKEVEAPDENTLRVTLTRPSPSFLAALALERHLIRPRHLSGTGKIVGTGPFLLEGQVPKFKAELVRNPGYFRSGLPYLEGITFYFVEEASTLAAALRAGRLHLSSPWGGLSAAEAGLLAQGTPPLVVEKAPSLSYYAFLMNHRMPLWSDVRVRQAASLALSRPQAIDKLGQGQAELGGLLVPGTPWALSHQELLAFLGYRQAGDEERRAEARRLLKEVGVPPDFAGSLMVGLAEEQGPLVAFLQEQLGQVGLNLKLVGLSPEHAHDIMTRHAFETTLSRFEVPLADPEAIFGLSYVSEAPGNYQNFQSATVDELFRKQAQTLAPLQRQRLVKEMEREALRQVPRLILWWQTHFVARVPQVKGYRLGIGEARDLSFEQVWLAR